MNFYELNTQHVPSLFGDDNCNAKTIFQFFDIFYGNLNNSTATPDANAFTIINIWQNSLNFVFKENTAPQVLNLAFNNLPPDFPPTLQKFKEIATACQNFIWELEYEKEKTKRALMSPKISEQKRLENIQRINDAINKIFISKKF